jgi:hypothetical protein
MALRGYIIGKKIQGGTTVGSKHIRITFYNDLVASRTRISEYFNIKNLSTKYKKYVPNSYRI